MACAALAAALARLAAPAQAAETDFLWDAGLRAIYSQDVLRTGDDTSDDVISSLTASAGVRVRTPRSELLLGYSPELLKYAEFTEFDHLDHHEHGEYTVRPGPRSEFLLREGYSLSTRQVGFADLVGAGGAPAQPVTVRTERTVWDVEPRWVFRPRMLHAFTLGALYRSESYGGESAGAAGGFIDSDQFGMQAQYDHPVGRTQTFGGRIKGDRYRFEQAGLELQSGFYDQFFNLGIAWSLRHPGRFDLSGAAGAYRGSGQGVEDVLKPTADLSGTWQWVRKALRLGYILGYSSGGGLTTSEQSQSVNLNYNVSSVRGWQFGASGSTLRRKPLSDEPPLVNGVPTTGTAEPLYGYHLEVALGRQWRSGLSLSATAGFLHQQETTQTGVEDLQFFEGSVGVRFSPPEPPPRPARPSTY